MIGSHTFLDGIAQRLSENHMGVFSTVGADGAKARTVDYIFCQGQVAFFSWRYSAKIDEIIQMPHVAFCVNEIQIEGQAEVREIDDPEVNTLMECYHAELPELFEKFMTLPAIVLITVKPERIKRMIDENNGLYIESYQLGTGEYTKKKLSDW